MKNPPKFHDGDTVKILEHGDPDYGKVLSITGLSPSTKVKRSNGQWRYRLTNGGYYSENHLERV